MGKICARCKIEKDFSEFRWRSDNRWHSYCKKCDREVIENSKSRKNRKPKDKSTYVYMEVTKDKYRLPVAIADSTKELAMISGTTMNVVSSTISHNVKNGRFIKVRIDDE